MNKDHPAFDQLLSLMDGDIALTGDHVRTHVGTCRECRAEMDNFSAALADYAFFEEAVMLPAIPPPARPWLDLRAAMREFDSSRSAARFPWSFASVFLRVSLVAAVLGALAFAIVTITRRQAPLDKPVARPSSSTPAAAERRAAASNSPKAEISRPRVPVDAGSPAVEPPINIEVRVFAALHRLGADLGEPIEVGTDSQGRVLVAGKGLSPDRQAEIRDALAAEPRVVVAFGQATARTTPTAPQEVATVDAGAPLQSRLEKLLGGRTAYESLSTRTLDESDAVVARAHALHNLGERFPAARRPELAGAERAALDAMIAAHRTALHQHAQTLLRLIEPVSKSAPAAAPQPAPAVLESAQRMDRVLSVIFGGHPSALSPDELTTELSNASAALRAALAAYQ